MTTTFVNKNTSTQLIPPKFSELFFLVLFHKKTLFVLFIRGSLAKEITKPFRKIKRGINDLR